MFSFKFTNFKALKARGSIFVLFALLLPVMLMFFILAVDFGLLYSERTKLQGIADAAALAGATERYQKPNANVQLPSLSENVYNATSNSGKVIAGRIWEYLLLNGQQLAKPVDGDEKCNCSDVTPGYVNFGMESGNALESQYEEKAIGDGAFQFTNFTEDDSKIMSYSMGANIMENYSAFGSNYNKDNYDGPEIADIPENIGKIAVQCGVPVDNKDRVRVRLRKIVPTIFIHLFYSGYDNGVPVTVVAAAQTRKPRPTFRLVGLHGMWINFTSIPNNENIDYGHDPGNLKYIEGDVYCGDNLSVCGESGFVAHTSVNRSNDSSDKFAGYHPNQFTVKGRLFTRNYSTGTTSRPKSNELAGKTDINTAGGRDYELFYKMPAPNGDRHSADAEYLYMRYDDENKTMQYALESKLDLKPEQSINEGWYHVYNFNRYTSWERVKVWNGELQRFMAYPPHLMRIGLAPLKDRMAFLAATKSALSLRQTYRMNLNSLYKEAIRALGTDRKSTTTMWRYLKASQKADAKFSSVNCTIKSTDKNIKLLVEIDGVSTTDKSTGNYLSKKALAFLGKENTSENLNIEQLVVVIKDGSEDNKILNSTVINPGSREEDYTVYHNGKYYNPETTLREQTGSLMIEDVASGLTIGDVYSEANLCLAGNIGNRDNIITFNGVLFSEKNVVVPYSAQSHNFTGSCSIFGNRLIMGYSYGNKTISSADRNFSCVDLTAGLDYPVNVLVRKRHLFNTKLSDHLVDVGESFTPTVDSDVPMHYVLLGLTDEEYHAEVFKGESNADFNDDKDPASLELKEYDYNYNYHWFNPDMQMVYYSLDKDKLVKLNNKYLYKFSDGHYGLQRLNGINTEQINPTDYFDVYKSGDSSVEHLMVDLNSDEIKKPISDLISEDDLRNLRNNWHVAPNSSEDHKYLKHIIAFMPDKDGTKNPNGTLYHYEINSYYPYAGGNYKLKDNDDVYRNLPLFTLPSENRVMLQLYGPSVNSNDSGRVMNNILFTPIGHNSSLGTHPWIRISNGKYTGNDNVDLYIQRDILKYDVDSYVGMDNGLKYYPWYHWLPSTGKKDTNVSLIDANRVYLNFWKRAALYGGDNNSLMNPFSYCPPGDQRDKIIKMVQGVADDATEIGKGVTSIAANSTRAMREGFIYSYTVDIDMMVAYRIDDLMRFNVVDSGKMSVSDSKGTRLYDEATDQHGTFGTYPDRNGATGQKYITHSFGLPDDSVYTSIGLVE